MTREMDLCDIQGNVLRAYAADNYPVARYICFHISVADAGRAFVNEVRNRVMTAERWARGAAGCTGDDRIERPEVAVNIALSYRGLVSLELSTRALRQLPAVFMDGMGRRAGILGDTGPSDPAQWDHVWRTPLTQPTATADAPTDDDVHILVVLNARARPDGTAVEALDDMTTWLSDLCAASGGGVRILPGHGPDGADWQDASALMRERDGRMVPSAKEHFGFSDGISNPVLEGQYPPEVEAVRVRGRGKLLSDRTWAPLAAGEVVLGQPDEAQEIPPSAPPPLFLRNGTFMAFRKLHQNVHGFRSFIEKTAESYARVMGVSREEAQATVRAKMVGRWDDGVPLTAAPDFTAWKAFRRKWDPLDTPEKRRDYNIAIADITYSDDPDGLKCPLGAHVRRANTRDMLDPLMRRDPEHATSALNKRRRIMRRGLPYGTAPAGAQNDDGEHGIIFIALCADLFRQFEFMQQQWMQHGLDFEAGNDTCPVVGTHEAGARFVIPSTPESGKPPFICANLPQFVTTRGGEYFFVPGMTALRLMATGGLDPT